MRTINIFLGGGVQLLHGDEAFRGYRNDVIDPVVGQLNAVEGSGYLFIAKDYSDLTRNVVSGKQQNVYNRYIVKAADAALFIINGSLGNLTRHEIDCAVASAKKKKHPLVFIYGTNIREDDEIIEYLNQEGIYYQHFFDNRDLAAKIKADLQVVASAVSKKRRRRLTMSLLTAAVAALLAIGGVRMISPDPATDADCTAQLYLMRYKDINSLVDSNMFTDESLAQFKYEDSIIEGKSVRIFPVWNSDSAIRATSPFLRIKLHNKNRNTIVLVEAELEVDSLRKAADLPGRMIEFTPTETSEADKIEIEPNKKTYRLKGFRQNVAYGETDDRYFFYLEAPYSCSLRARVKARTQKGDYIYSNYIYLDYIR